MELTFTGEIWYWRGPSPFLFVTVPEAEADAIGDVSRVVTYGWGMIPCAVRIGATSSTTSLWPKNGGYIVPIKKVLQDGEQIAVGDVVTVTLAIDI